MLLGLGSGVARSSLIQGHRESGVFTVAKHYAVYSGVDILLVAGYPDASKVEQFYDEFLEATKEDDTLARCIQDSAKKILELKLALFKIE
ncbi:MAG: hypothetical protein Q8P55_01720 [bacterium]|nr:hypothetical protein [bacterium]